MRRSIFFRLGNTKREVDDMRQKLYFIILMLCLVITGSTMAWLYFDYELPKKSPVRAKQVYLIDTVSDSGSSVLAKL